MLKRRVGGKQKWVPIIWRYLNWCIYDYAWRIDGEDEYPTPIPYNVFILCLHMLLAMLIRSRRTQLSYRGLNKPEHLRTILILRLVSVIRAGWMIATVARVFLCVLKWSPTNCRPTLMTREHQKIIYVAIQNWTEYRSTLMICSFREVDFRFICFVRNIYNIYVWRLIART